MSTTESTSNNKKMNPAWIYIPVIIALAGVAGYFYFEKQKSESKGSELTEQVNAISDEKTTVQSEYDAALVRLDEMKGQSLQMDSVLTSQQDEVNGLKARIKEILGKEKATEAELKEANELIAVLNKKLSSFQEVITNLKKENIQLSEDKRQLTDEKIKLNIEKDEVTKEKESLKSDKNQLEKTLEKTVETASILHASNFRLEPINQKKNLLGKEKEAQTNKARKADLVRISFDLDDNRISESGEKMIYICVSTPSGVTASAAGKFKLSNGNEKSYTTTKIIAYKKGEKAQNIITDWKPLEDFNAGDYKVELYHMGNLIGSEKVTLK